MVRPRGERVLLENEERRGNFGTWYRSFNWTLFTLQSLPTNLYYLLPPYFPHPTTPLFTLSRSSDTYSLFHPFMFPIRPSSPLDSINRHLHFKDVYLRPLLLTVLTLLLVFLLDFDSSSNLHAGSFNHLPPLLNPYSCIFYLYVKVTFPWISYTTVIVNLRPFSFTWGDGRKKLPLSHPPPERNPFTYESPFRVSIFLFYTSPI